MLYASRTLSHALAYGVNHVCLSLTAHQRLPTFCTHRWPVLHAPFTGHAAPCLYRCQCDMLRPAANALQKGGKQTLRTKLKNIHLMCKVWFACRRDPTLQKAEEIRTRRQLCFVMTDLEGSTAMASKNQNVFVNIQEVHDVVRNPRGRIRGRASYPRRGMQSSESVVVRGLQNVLNIFCCVCLYQCCTAVLTSPGSPCSCQCC